jgi:choline dehydrogenase
MPDFVIIGGGSSGCALAARLTEDPDVSVLLLEAGPRDSHPYIHMPVGFAKMTAGPFTWGLKTAPQRHANNREIVYAQARVLGGGGSINAEIYTRGVPADYDDWASEHGCEGWSWRDVLPRFLRSEDNDTLAGPLHGHGGPLGVSNLHPQPITRAFIQACQELGIPYNPDFNGARQDGAGAYQTTIRGGRRCSAAVGYLKPARGRKNLTVETGCLVTRIRVENGRATGVDYVQGGQKRTAVAEREVLVTAGAIGSPKILMLSGIGPADQLKAHAIPIAADLPAVGQNLHDHFGVDIVYELKGPHSLDKYNKAHWMAWAGLQYALFRSGPVASNIVEGGAFWYADKAAPSPDLQFHFLAGAGVEAGVPVIPSGSGVTLNSYTLRPRSRGSVTLRSADPAAPPVVDPNFIADPYDLRTTAEGIKLSREMLGQPSMARYVRREHFPGDKARTQKEVEDYARQYGRTSYHPVGTCRMGGDEASVVDPRLKVRGVEGLRVCDASIMPRVVSSNTNAAAIMIGEMASDFLRGNRP